MKEMLSRTEFSEAHTVTVCSTVHIRRELQREDSAGLSGIMGLAEPPDAALMSAFGSDPPDKLQIQQQNLQHSSVFHMCEHRTLVSVVSASSVLAWQ